MLGNKSGEQTARHMVQIPRVGLLRRYGAGADWQAVLEDAGEDGSGIVVGSAAWFVWLAAPSTQSFGYPVYDAQAGYIDGFMTVRKEGRARGGRYWVAYRRMQGRLRKVYLGASGKLTHQALEQVAQTLLAASTRTAPGQRSGPVERRSGAMVLRPGGDISSLPQGLDGGKEATTGQRNN